MNMNKIDGTLYGPANHGEREKIYIETVPEAVILNDGTTLIERLDTKNKPFIISKEKPDRECIWVIPDDDAPVLEFDFSDVVFNLPEDSTKIHTLRTPADSTGVRQVVYPLTDAKNVKTRENESLDDVLNRYEMGGNLGRIPPDNRAFWLVESYSTAKIDSFGKDEEVIILNSFFESSADIGGVHYEANNYVFNIDDDKYVLFNQESKLVKVTKQHPNKACFWINSL